MDDGVSLELLRARLAPAGLRARASPPSSPLSFQQRCHGRAESLNAQLQVCYTVFFFLGVLADRSFQKLEKSHEK
ncbi:hypothetical protein BJX65DRAFT_97203 [Aspergillus insuetus]